MKNNKKKDKRSHKKSSNSVGKNSSGSQAFPGKEKKVYSAVEVAMAWQSFEPKIPLSYALAAREAARIKNSH